MEIRTKMNLQSTNDTPSITVRPLLLLTKDLPELLRHVIWLLGGVVVSLTILHCNQGNRYI